MAKEQKREGNVYDRIFKENAETIFIPLIERELKVQIKSFKPLPQKIAKTMEREMDFFYQILTQEEQTFLLHIEFQTRDDKTMLYRMAEYHGLAYRKYKLPIQHVVIYLGTGIPKMKTHVPPEETYTGFTLINLHALDTTALLSSQVPEVIVLALLSQYERERTESVLRLLITQLKTVCNSEEELTKYLTQLIILSRLRNLQDITTKIIETMPVSFDIRKDGLYKRGHQEGQNEGRNEEKDLRITSLLESGLLTVAQIASTFDVTVEYVLAIQKKLDKK